MKANENGSKNSKTFNKSDCDFQNEKSNIFNSEIYFNKNNIKKEQHKNNKSRKRYYSHDLKYKFRNQENQDGLKLSKFIFETKNKENKKSDHETLEKKEIVNEEDFNDDFDNEGNSTNFKDSSYHSFESEFEKEIVTFDHLLDSYWLKNNEMKTLIEQIKQKENIISEIPNDQLPIKNFDDPIKKSISEKQDTNSKEEIDNQEKELDDLNKEESLDKLKNDIQSVESEDLLKTSDNHQNNIKSNDMNDQPNPELQYSTEIKDNEEIKKTNHDIHIETENDKLEEDDPSKQDHIAKEDNNLLNEFDTVKEDDVVNEESKIDIIDHFKNKLDKEKKIYEVSNKEISKDKNMIKKIPDESWGEIYNESNNKENSLSDSVVNQILVTSNYDDIYNESIQKNNLSTNEIIESEVNNEIIESEVNYENFPTDLEIQKIEKPQNINNKQKSENLIKQENNQPDKNDIQQIEETDTQPEVQENKDKDIIEKEKVHEINQTNNQSPIFLTLKNENLTKLEGNKGEKVDFQYESVVIKKPSKEEISEKSKLLNTETKITENQNNFKKVYVDGNTAINKKNLSSHFLKKVNFENL